MKATLIASTLVGLAVAAPQGVTDKIPPEGATPQGCQLNYDGKFEITVAHVTKEKRDVQRRADCGANGALVMTLKDGSTFDSQQRTGYIASNYQFQFDGPPQAGAIYTSGFSLCEDSTLALGSNTTFYRCLSGDFYNLYNVNWAEQCSPVEIIALPCGSSAAAGQQGDGQVVGTTVVQTTIVTALTDGQPQVITTAVPVPVTSYYPTSAAVSQISDGQIQVPPPQTPTSVATGSAPVSVPAPTTTKAPTSAPVSAPSAPTYSASSSAVAPSAPVSSSAARSSSAAATSAASSAASSAPAATTSAPSQSGSSRTTTASVGALVVAIIALCL